MHNGTVKVRTRETVNLPNALDTTPTKDLHLTSPPINYYSLTTWFSKRRTNFLILCFPFFFLFFYVNLSTNNQLFPLLNMTLKLFKMLNTIGMDIPNNWQKQKIKKKLHLKTKSVKVGSHITDDEVRGAEEKFAESLHLAQLGMYNLLENDVSRIESFTWCLIVEDLMHFHCKYLRVFFFFRLNKYRS